MGSAEQQSELWSKQAEGWMKYFEPTFVPLWEHMLKITKVGNGTDFFDAGCGAGGASVFAAKLGAKITGFDATQALLDIAETKVPQGKFLAGDLESLPYEDAQFDVVFAANSVQFTENPTQTLRELKRVCKPNGKIVVAVWPPPTQNGQGAVILAIVELTQKKPKVGPFALSAPGLLESCIQEAGLKVVTDEEFPCDFTYDSFEGLWNAQRTTGPAQIGFEMCGEAAIKDAVRKATEKYIQADGRAILTNKIRCVLMTP